MKRMTILALAIALVLAGAIVSQATTLRRMDLDELTAAASVVARVRCLASDSRWEGGQIWTFTTLEVTETLKGTAPAQIVVRLVGGHVGHLTSTVDGVPRFRAGEEAILFLEPAAGGEFSVTSWAQGTFRIRRDIHAGRESVTQDTGGLSLFDPATRQFYPGGVKNLLLEEFRQRVAEAVARTARRQK